MPQQVPSQQLMLRGGMHQLNTNSVDAKVMWSLMLRRWYAERHVSHPSQSCVAWPGAQCAFIAAQCSRDKVEWNTCDSFVAMSGYVSFLEVNALPERAQLPVPEPSDVPEASLSEVLSRWQIFGPTEGDGGNDNCETEANVRAAEELHQLPTVPLESSVCLPRWLAQELRADHETRQRELWALRRSVQHTLTSAHRHRNLKEALLQGDLPPHGKQKCLLWRLF